MSDLSEPNKQTVRLIIENFVRGLGYDLSNLEDLKQLDQVGYEIFKAGREEAIKECINIARKSRHNNIIITNLNELLKEGVDK